MNRTYMPHPASRASIALALAAASLAVPFAHAGIDCSGKLTAVEALICDMPLQEEDLKLNRQYAAIMALPGVDKARIRAAQKRWLTTVRDACSDYTCLSDAYRKRILELWEQRMSLTPVKHKPPTREEALRDCTDMAALADRRTLSAYLIPGYDRQDDAVTLSAWEVTDAEAAKYRDRVMSDSYRTYRLRTGQSNRLQRFGEFSSGGTCSWRHIFSIERLVAGKPVSVLDELNAREGDLSSDSDFLVFFNQRNYLLNSFQWNIDRSIREIRWVRPDGETAPVCTVLKASSPRLMENRIPELCEGVLNGNIKPLEGVLQPLPGKDEQPAVIARFFHDPPNAGDFRLLRMDADGDGKEELLGYFEESRMAGCGITYQWFYALDRSGEPGGQKPLNALLDRAEADAVYRFRGQAYFKGTDAVYDWKIFRIHDARIEPVCRFLSPNKVELVHP